MSKIEIYTEIIFKELLSRSLHGSRDLDEVVLDLYTKAKSAAEKLFAKEEARKN